MFVKSVLKSLEFNFWRVAAEEVTIWDGGIKERGTNLCYIKVM